MNKSTMNNDHVSWNVILDDYDDDDIDGGDQLTY